MKCLGPSLADVSGCSEVGAATFDVVSTDPESIVTFWSSAATSISSRESIGSSVENY